jgi:hypothetical protein
MILGMHVLRMCRMREYDWMGRKGKKLIADWDFFNKYL